jgi:type IV pilus assembly protein PilV
MVSKKYKYLSQGKNQGGFTLIEVLMSMMIMAIGLLAISMMQAHFANGNSQSREIIRASDIAMDHIEDLSNKSISHPDLALGIQMRTITDYEIDYTLSWTVTDSGNGTYAVNTTVSWQKKSQQHSVNFPWIKNI